MCATAGGQGGQQEGPDIGVAGQGAGQQLQRGGGVGAEGQGVCDNRAAAVSVGWDGMSGLYHQLCAGGMA